MLAICLRAAVILILSAGLRAAAQDGTADILINPAAGVTITVSGSYRLVSDVVLTATNITAISVQAREVTLDLGGHTITAAQNAMKPATA